MVINFYYVKAGSTNNRDRYGDFVSCLPMRRACGSLTKDIHRIDDLIQ